MNRTNFILRILLVPLDFVAVFLAGLSAYALRSGGLVTGLRPVGYIVEFHDYVRIILAVAVAATVIFFIGGLYSMRPNRRFADELVRIFYASSTVILGIIVLIFFQRDLFSSRFVILAGWIFGFGYVLIAHGIVRVVRQGLHRRGLGVDRAVVVGSYGDAEGLAAYLHKHPETGVHVVGRLQTLDGDFKTAMDTLRSARGVDLVIQADPTLDRERVSDLQEYCDEHHLEFTFAPDRFSARRLRLEMLDIGGYPLLHLQRTPLEGWGKVAKRLLDIVGALFFIVLFSPLYILCALLIKLDSAGPVFFARVDDGQRLHRVGLHGRPFWYFKFRTMKPGTHQLRYTKEFSEQSIRQGPVLKFKDDPRITRVGKYLRRFSLDELPEFFLVLRGNMSLVGPRPHEPEEVARYTSPQRRVLRIKPGITGMAQVSGRSDLTFDDEVRMDMFYIERWSIWLDLRILLRTPFAVIGKRKAT